MSWLCAVVVALSGGALPLVRSSVLFPAVCTVWLSGLPPAVYRGCALWISSGRSLVSLWGLFRCACFVSGSVSGCVTRWLASRIMDLFPVLLNVVSLKLCVRQVIVVTML